MGVHRYGTGDMFSNIWTGQDTVTSVPLLFEQSIRVKLSLFHS